MTMFGQIPDFTNGFEFLRNLWGAGSGMPSGLMPGLQAMTPPMDLDEVDKRIHDLKAVESWLQLNTNLLRTTIQGLEVQRATLVALQTFGKALSPDAMQSAMENVARAANAPSATPHHAAFTMPTRAPEPDVEDEIDDGDDDGDIEYPPDVGTAAAADTEGDDENTEALPDDAQAGDASPGGSAADAGTHALPPNASLWWNLLQQQFNQIASSAAAASMVPFGNLGAVSPGAGMGQPAQPDASPKAATTSAAGRKPAGKRATAAKPAAKKAPKKAPKKAATKAPKKAAKTGTNQGATKPATAKKTAASKPSRTAAKQGATPSAHPVPPAPNEDDSA